MYINRLMVALLVVCVVLQPVHAGERDIQRILDERIENGMAVGLAVGMVHGDSRQFYFAGTLRADGHQPIDENTIFEIGSVSKVFTTLLLALMEDKGEVKLSDPAQKYLPATVKLPTRDGKVITLEHLATHTSALPRMPSNFDPKDPANPYADYTVEQMYDFLSHHTLGRNIGGQSEYSNLGMGLLGHLLARRAGTSYEDLMISRICKPLGMTSTNTKPRPKQADRVATGHQGRKPVSGWDIPTLAGAGDINSTVKDMLIFVAANLGLQKSKLYGAMQRCHIARVDTADPQLKVGLGWHIWKKNGSDIIWHNGGTGGFASFIGFRKDRNEGVVVLSNSAYRGVDQMGLHLLNDKYELPSTPKETKIDSKILNDYVGTYTLPIGQIFTVKVDNGQLMVKISGQDYYPVFPEK